MQWIGPEVLRNEIPAILERVASGADLLPEFMLEWYEAEEPDQDTLRGIQREREAAGRKVTFDRVLPAALFGDGPAGLGGDATAALDGDAAA